MSLSVSKRVDALLAWCSHHKFEIDPRIQIKEDPDRTEIGVFSKNFLIPPSTIVQIPKSAVLSARSCSLSSRIPWHPYGHEASLALSLALYSEMLLGKSSRWYGYLQSLPPNGGDVPLLWDLEVVECQSQDGLPISNMGSHGDHGHRCDQTRSEDGIEALSWIQGTEIDRQLRGSSDDGRRIIDDIRQYYKDTAEPLLYDHLFASVIDESPFNHPTLGGFIRAYSLVSSRAFLVDAYHGMAMVPIADAFNHTTDNHVHLESDYDVCITCGSVQECPHDREEPTFSDVSSKNPTATPSSSSADLSDASLANDFDAYYEMVSDVVIPPDSEIYNTYGHKLSNAQLLVRYGFTLEANMHDCLNWDLSELSDYITSLFPSVGTAHSVEQTTETWARIITAPQNVWELFDNSRLTFFNPNLPSERFQTADDSILCIDGDGKLSHQLWIYFTLFHLLNAEAVTIQPPGREGVSDEQWVTTLRRILDLQLDLEEAVEKMAESDGKPEEGSIALAFFTDQHDNKLLEFLAGASSLVVSLCDSRRRRMRKAETDELCDIMDNLPEHMTRTRLVLAQVVTERSILDSCESAWMDMQGSLNRILITECPTRLEY